MKFLSAGTQFGTIARGDANIASPATSSDLGLTAASGGKILFAANGSTALLASIASTGSTLYKGLTLTNTDSAAYTVVLNNSAGSSGFQFQTSGVQKMAFGTANFDITSQANTDMGFTSEANVLFASGGHAANNIRLALLSGGTIQAGSGNLIGWSSTTPANGTADTGIARNAAGVVEINNGTAGTYSDLKLRRMYPVSVTDTFSATPTFDGSNSMHTITLTGNVTSATLSNLVAGEHIDFLICQDGTGSRTFVWPTNTKGGMTIGSTASTCSAQSFTSWDGTTAYATTPGVINQ
jgi:hypothetical protein